MIRTSCLFVTATLLLPGCADSSRVIFVTVSSVGINLDNKPATVSIAYDRTEGYIGPRYPNGAVPPVVASIETGGNIFSPKIRQLYATGVAALLAVKTPNPQTGETSLVRSSDKNRLIFFGTTTTLGVKAGFSGDGYPDSFTFGYKRKEFSFIPLGSKVVNGVTTDTYPSVLGSIDTTTNVKSKADAGLTSTQFFATGQAAETLANSAAVTETFSNKAEETLTASLTAQQRLDALAAGRAQRTSQDDQLRRILSYVAPGGTVDAARLATLVDATNGKFTSSVPSELKSKTSEGDIRTLIGNNQYAVSSLYKMLSAMQNSH